MPNYSYADITLSSMFPMAGLLGGNGEEKSPTFTFRLLESPPSEPVAAEWLHDWRTTAGDITVSLARLAQGYLLRFPSLADFIIDQAGFGIGAWPLPGTDEDTVRHLLLDQVLPRALSRQGCLVLHASAVSVEGQALAFVGDTGRGKSTLAASLHLAGYPLLSDDGLVLRAAEGNIKAVPCYSGLRLLPESVAALFEKSPRKKAMASYSPKNRVVLPETNEAAACLDLAALFVLGKPRDGNIETGVTVVKLLQREACMALVRNAFQLDVTDHRQVGTLFSAAATAAAGVPVFSLSYHRDFSSLPAVHEAILQMYRNTAKVMLQRGLTR